MVSLLIGWFGLFLREVGYRQSILPVFVSDDRAE